MSDGLKRSPANKIKPTAEGICTKYNNIHRPRRGLHIVSLVCETNYLVYTSGTATAPPVALALRCQFVVGSRIGTYEHHQLILIENDVRTYVPSVSIYCCAYC